MQKRTESVDPFAGDGEMSLRMRAHDWSATSLGPVEAWPQSLKIAVYILLSSRYAMWLGWSLHGPPLRCCSLYHPGRHFLRSLRKRTCSPVFRRSSWVASATIGPSIANAGQQRQVRHVAADARQVRQRADHNHALRRPPSGTSLTRDSGSSQVAPHAPWECRAALYYARCRPKNGAGTGSSVRCLSTFVAFLGRFTLALQFQLT